jgi:hypothetical protein
VDAFRTSMGRNARLWPMLERGDDKPLHTAYNQILGNRTMCRKMLGFGVIVVAIAAAASFSVDASTTETASALLEKAIYTEETVGDLPGAAKLYERAVAEAKRGETVAAKAQYRLGLCLLKQGKKEQGIAALEEVGRRFPNQKELVAAARKHTPTLPALKLRPPVWSEGESLHYRGRLDDGQELGTSVDSVESATLDGKKIWRFRSWNCLGGSPMATRVDADFDSLMPIDRSLTVSGQIRYKQGYKYERGKVIANTIVGGKTTTSEIEVHPDPYDQQEGNFVLRCLPMAEKFTTHVPFFPSTSGTPVSVRFEVTGKETVEVPAGKFHCFRVRLRVMSITQTYWFSDDAHRYPVKIDVGSAVIQLVKIERLDPGKAKKYSNAEFALTLPPGWNAYRVDASVFVVAPDVDWNIVVKTKKLNQLSQEEKKSPRAWAERGLPDAVEQQHLKNLKVRPNSWLPATVSGRPAASYVTDFTAIDGTPMAQYVVCVFGKTAAASFTVTCPRDGLDRIKKAIHPVVESLEVK